GRDIADQVDVAVLGGGSGGAAVALRLAEAGRSVAMIEERLVGGECPYFACMPSKAMLQAAARGMPWPEAVAFRDDASGHRDDSDTARQVEQAGVEVIRGHGVVTGRGELIVGARTLRWRDLVVATGAAPSRPPIDGLDDVDVWTSEDALSNRELPRSLVVLGGGAVGCELSQIYARFGADVTVVETAERLLADEPDFVGDALAAALHDDGVTLALGSTVQRVGSADGGIRVHGEDGSTHDGERLV